MIKSKLYVGHCSKCGSDVEEIDGPNGTTQLFWCGHKDVATLRRNL